MHYHRLPALALAALLAGWSTGQGYQVQQRIDGRFEPVWLVFAK